MNPHKKRRLYSTKLKPIKATSFSYIGGWRYKGVPPHMIINMEAGKPTRPNKKLPSVPYFSDNSLIYPKLTQLDIWQRKRYITLEEEQRLTEMYKSPDKEMRALFDIIFESKEKGFKRWMKKKKSKRRVPQYLWLTTSIG